MVKITNDPRSQAGVVRLPPPPPKLTDEEVAEFAIELGRLHNASEIALAREIGERIIKRLFRGSIDLYHEYNRGDLTLVKVVEYLQSNGFEGWNRTRLDRAVTIYHLGERVGGFAQFDNLSISHLYLVVGMPVEIQTKLLTEANAKGLTKTELEAQVLRLRNKKRRTEGKQTSLIHQALTRVNRIQDALRDHEEWMPDITAAGLDAQAIKRLDDAIDVCVREAEAVAQELAKVLPPPKKSNAAKDAAADS